MKKAVAFIFCLCLCVGLFGCSSDQSGGTELLENDNLKTAQEHIANGQYEEAYGLLYAIKNRSAEEERLFAQFSFVLTMSETTYSGGKVEVETYDDNGYCIERMTTYAKGSWEKTTYTRDKAGNPLTVKTITSSGGWRNITNTYDMNGNHIAMDYESDWEGQQKYRKTYDQNGNMLTEVITRSNGPTTTTTCTYDAYNNVIKEECLFNGRLDIREFKYTYDADGRMLSVATSGNKETYTYDSQGRLTTETRYEKGKQTSKTVYTYDEHNNILTTTKTNAAGAVSQDTNKYNYDQYGNLLQKIAISSDGEQDITVFTYQLIYRQFQ